MLNKISKMVLFLLAYLPLFVSVAIKSFFSFRTIIIIFIISVLIIGLAFLLLNSIKTIVPSNEDIRIIELRNSEYLSFIVTYLVPFFGFNADIPTIVSLAIIILIIAFIYMDTSLFLHKSSIKNII